MGTLRRSLTRAGSRRPGARRGSTLAFVLVVATLAFLIAFVFAGTTSAHLGFSNRSSRALRARLLAEAAVTRAVAELQSDPEWGREGQALLVQLPGNPEGAIATLGFEAGREAISTYNLDSDTSRPGFAGRLVPAHSVHLVGEGECLGVRRRVEAIVTLPPYPYAIASSGPIESDGELLVGALDGQGGEGPITAETLYPAHLASNDPVEGSISLGPRTTIVGDVRSVGGLQLSEGVVVKGQTLAYGEPVALPEISIESYDPETAQTGFQVLPNELAGTSISGTARAPGDLTIYGDLDLDQGKLYVNGHLTVYGLISGRGLVVAREGATVTTGARMAGGQAVLLSGDDVLLKGGGPLGSFFQGMVYCEGAFEASDITVVGSFISKGSQAAVKLKNARVLGDTSANSWSPSGSQVLYFVAGQRRGEPAVQVPSPTSDSFSIEVRVRERSGQTNFEIVDPTTGLIETYQNVHVAARQLAVLANDMARVLPAGQSSGTGRNLVASAENLEGLLQGMADDLQRTSGEGFDLNKFLSVSDRLRVVLWREL